MNPGVESSRRGWTPLVTATTMALLSAPAWGLGLQRAWSSLRLSSETPGTPRRLLPPNPLPQAAPSPLGAQSRAGAPLGSPASICGVRPGWEGGAAQGQGWV